MTDDNLIITKNNLKKWLNKLKPYGLYAPVNRNECVSFERIEDVNEIVLNRKPVKPVKDMVLPKTEIMFKFSKNKTDVSIHTGDTNKEYAVIFGIKPCEARGLCILDNVFNDEYKDIYYIDRRKRYIYIGIACNTPDYNCFCTSVGGSPCSKDGMDILITDIGDKYFVELITDKGKELINKKSTFFKKSTEDDIIAKDDIQNKSINGINRKIDTGTVTEKLNELFDNPLWDTQSQKCISCGICTYLCPVCYCFDITDEISGNGTGARIRTWDTCQYPDYTKQASGHNPRSDKKSRLRNRIYHKFKYFPDEYNVVACVGCGRCVDLCPVNIDIIDILMKIINGGDTSG